MKGRYLKIGPKKLIFDKLVTKEEREELESKFGYDTFYFKRSKGRTFRMYRYNDTR